MFTSNTIGRECTHNRGIGIVEFCFIRNTLNFLLSFIPLWYSGVGLFDGFNKETKWPMIIKTVAGNLGYFTHTLTFKMLPLGSAM